MKPKEENTYQHTEGFRFLLITHYTVLITLVVVLATALPAAARGGRPTSGAFSRACASGRASARHRHPRHPRLEHRQPADGRGGLAFGLPLGRGRLSLPTTPDLAANRDELVASRIVETAKLAKLAPEVYVYHELLRALEDYGGYREGDWENPPADGDRDTFYVFAYDWRRDNVESARLLVGRVEALKQKLGRPDLRFNVVAHSMGGLVARYAAMYGDRDLPPEGAQPQPDWAGASFVSKIFMFGTPNEGSAEAFAVAARRLLRDRGSAPPRAPPQQALARGRDDHALHLPTAPARRAGALPRPRPAPSELDLYDPEIWRRYGWSAANDPEFREAYARGVARGQEAPRGAARSRSSTRTSTRCSRARAASTRRSTRRPTDAPVKLFAFGGDCEETLAAPVILRDEKRGAG